MNLKNCEWCGEGFKALRDSKVTKITLADESLDAVPFYVCSECTRLFKNDETSQLIIRMAGR